MTRHSRWPLCAGLVLVLLWIAWWQRPPARHRLDLVAVARDGLRPLALPVLWTQRARQRRSGTAVEQALRLRDIARLVPSWTDGELLAAAQMADAAPPGSDPETRWRHLATGLGWLQEARRRPEADQPELLHGMANLLLAGTAEGSELRRPAQRALGQAPEAQAVAWLEEAARLRPTEATAGAIRYLRPALLLGALRDRDLPRAIQAWTDAVAALRRSPDPAAERWLAALEEVQPALLQAVAGEPPLTPAERDRWLADPYLAEFAAALPE